MSSFSSSVPKFNISFYLSNSPKDLTFTDLITTNYTSYGVTLSNFKALLKIVAPNGIIYQNTDYADDDFANPDIDGDASDWSESGIALPTDSDGYVLQGTYTFYYKISIDGGSTVECTVEKEIDYQYDTPFPLINVAHSCEESTLTATDNTDYDIEHDSEDIEATTISRITTIVYPQTSGQSDETGSTQSFIIGANIWTGTYQIGLSVDLVYDLETWGDYDWFTIYDTMTGETSHLVECDNCACQVYQCIVNLKELVDNYKSNRSLYDKYVSQLREINDNWMLYQIAERCGYDSGEYCNNIKSIAKSYGCSCEDADDSSTEIIPWSQASGTGSSTVNQWYSGAGTPSAGLGENDDFYLNETANGDGSHAVYKKSGGTWSVIFNMGATGADGTTASAVLSNDIGDVGTDAGTSEKDLKTYTVTADQLSDDGDMLYVRGLIEFAENNHGKTVRLYWDGNLLESYYTSALITASTKYFVFEAWISKSGTGAQFITTLAQKSHSAPVITNTTDSADETSTIVVKITGQNDDATQNDIVAKQMIVEFHNKS